MVIPWAAERLISDVDLLIQRARTQTDLQVQSDYAKYIVIRLSGLVEQVITEIVVTHASSRSSPEVTRHVEWRMRRRFQNPKMQKILELLGSYDRRWSEALELEISEPEKSALGSIVAQRNLVAHGGDSTVSLGQVARYFADVQVLLKKVAKQF